MTAKSNYNFRALGHKRLIKKWVNDYADPEGVVLRRDIADLPSDKREELFRRMREIADLLRKAFETDDLYERDWYCFMARYKNAVYTGPISARFNMLPGNVPMAKDSELDQAIAFVQSRLLKKMAVCQRPGCEKCYFRGGRKYHSRLCARAVLQGQQRKYWSKAGSELRRERERRKSTKTRKLAQVV